MKLYTLKQEQCLPVPLAEAWAFFSNPANLDTITPPSLEFTMLSDPEAMYAGQLIRYRIGILPGIKQFWLTEITQLDQERFFVDEQRFGPYRFWHHQHHFEEVETGVKMTDRVHYALPFGPLGTITHGLFVKNKLREIFDYRYKVVDEMFG